MGVAVGWLVGSGQLRLNGYKRLGVGVEDAQVWKVDYVFQLFEGTTKLST